MRVTQPPGQKLEASHGCSAPRTRWFRDYEGNLGCRKYTPATAVHADGVLTMLASLWGLAVRHYPESCLLLYVHVQGEKSFTRVCLARIAVTTLASPGAHVFVAKC